MDRAAGRVGPGVGLAGRQKRPKRKPAISLEMGERASWGEFSRRERVCGVPFNRRVLFFRLRRFNDERITLPAEDGQRRMTDRTVTHWQLRMRTLELGRRTLVMGIVNITPDSFSDGGLFLDPEAAVAHGLRLLDEGADLLDLGAESTRPGSRTDSSSGPAVSAEEEQARLLPVLERILRARPGAIVSVDTHKAATALAALQTGAEIVNDVSEFGWDAEMAAVCAEARCGVVLMHTRGRPEEWSTQLPPGPDALLDAVRAGLTASLEKAAAAGIALEAIVLDPGYGFGKRFEENYLLLARQAELLSLGRPLLAGVSR